MWPSPKVRLILSLTYKGQYKMKCYICRLLFSWLSHCNDDDAMHVGMPHLHVRLAGAVLVHSVHFPVVLPLHDDDFHGLVFYAKRLLVHTNDAPFHGRAVHFLLVFYLHVHGLVLLGDLAAPGVHRHCLLFGTRKLLICWQKSYR